MGGDSQTGATEARDGFANGRKKVGENQRIYLQKAFKSKYIQTLTVMG